VEVKHCTMASEETLIISQCADILDSPKIYDLSVSAYVKLKIMFIN